MATASEKSPLLLLVEDEAAMRKFLRSFLTGSGYRMVEASTGQQALQMAESAQPDLILLDLGLPDMDGQEVLRDLRQWIKVPIIILTIRDQDVQKITALDHGADDYITKPVDFEILTSIIHARLTRVARTAMWRQMVDLTGREAETLTWAARGKTSSEIATIIGLTKRTVDFHIDNARGKLGAATRTEAVLKAATGRLIEP